jgi:hypothetical protein
LQPGLATGTVKWGEKKPLASPWINCFIYFIYCWKVAKEQMAKEKCKALEVKLLQEGSVVVVAARCCCSLLLRCCCAAAALLLRCCCAAAALLRSLGGSAHGLALLVLLTGLPVGCVLLALV